MSFRMNFALLSIIALLLSLAPASAQKVQDVPLRITLHETAVLMSLDGTAIAGAAPVSSAIVGDGNDVYTNDRTTGVTIKFSSGTYDAVLNLLVGKRKLTGILPAPIPSSGTNPQTPPPGSYTSNGVFNIHNIICHGCTPGTFGVGKPYVTRASLELDNFSIQFLPLANISTYLPMAPSATGGAPSLAANSPNATSLAVVLPQSYDCSQGVYPSWIVRGTLPNTNDSSTSYLQVGTLFLSNIANLMTAGQFSMPFEAQIQALQCFNPGY
jgi:hypothetical protein